MTDAELIAQVAQAAGLIAADLVGSCRKPIIVRARHEAMRRLREAGVTRERISELLDKDIKSVWYGLRRAGERAQADG